MLVGGGVAGLRSRIKSTCSQDMSLDSKIWFKRGNMKSENTYVGFAGGAADGGEGEVDAEGEGGGCEEGFQLVDHGAEVVGGVAETTYDAEAAAVGDGGGEGGGGGVGLDCGVSESVLLV